jgi:hypothetical protein
MATYSFDGIKATFIIPAAGTQSNAIAVPRKAGTLTIWSPASLVTSTTWWFESLVPDGVLTTWDKVWFWPGLVGTPTVPLQAITTFHANDAVVYSAFMFGGGTIRIALTDAQTNGQTFYGLFSNFQD